MWIAWEGVGWLHWFGRSRWLGAVDMAFGGGAGCCLGCGISRWSFQSVGCDSRRDEERGSCCVACCVIGVW